MPHRPEVSVSEVARGEVGAKNSKLPFFSASGFWHETIYRFSQKILRFFSFIFFRLFTDLEIEGRENFRNPILFSGRPVIIAANHLSLFDPLVVGLAVPLFSGLYPLRFIAKDQLFIDLFSRIFFGSLGSMPAFRGQGVDKSLDAPKKILSKNGTVVIFPEGKRNTGEGLLPPRAGVGILAKEFPNCIIIPLAVSGTHKVSNPFSFSYPRVVARVGEPFSLSSSPRSVEESEPMAVAEYIMSKIAAEYEMIKK